MGREGYQTREIKLGFEDFLVKLKYLSLMLKVFNFLDK